MPSRLYDVLDRNHDNKLTPRELILALRKTPALAAELGLSATTHEGATRDRLMDYFHQIDVDQNDEISREEFIRFHAVARAGEEIRARDEERMELQVRNVVMEAHMQQRDEAGGEDGEIRHTVMAAKEVAGVAVSFERGLESQGNRMVDSFAEKAFNMSNETRNIVKERARQNV